MLLSNTTHGRPRSWRYEVEREGKEEELAMRSVERGICHIAMS